MHIICDKRIRVFLRKTQIPVELWDRLNERVYLFLERDWDYLIDRL